MPRTTKTITFSLPPEMAEQYRRTFSRVRPHSSLGYTAGNDALC